MTAGTARVAVMMFVASVLAQATGGWAGDMPNPVTERQTREEVFAFAKKPSVRSVGSDGSVRYAIAFETTAKCDATVAIVDPSAGSGQGKDDRVVRHLASGVLGKNAPWPFKQDSLAQTVEWDGKDDTGKPAPAGCKVKVWLGLQATYDKSFANFYGVGAGGFIVDKDGILHVVNNNLIRCFGRDGKYVKSLMPPLASVTPATFAGRPWVETTWGKHVMVGDWQSLFPNFKNGGGAIGTPAIGPDGRLAVLWNGLPTQLHLFGPDGSVPAISSMVLGDGKNGCLTGKGFNGEMSGGVHHMAVSPDGEWLYISGAGDAVLRYKWADLKGPKMPLQIFKGAVEKPGNDNESFNIVSGVACDAGNNVYVADNANHRIQVYKPDGTYLRTIKVEAPHRIAVHPKTGDIYALCWRSANLPPRNYNQGPTKLVKLNKDGQVLASLPVHANWHYWHFIWDGMALDAGAEPPAVWLSDKKGIFKVVDKGSSFEEVLRLGASVDQSILSGYVGNRIVVDRVREDVYLGEGSIFQHNPWIRIDGRTGKIDPTFKMKAIEMAIGPDGLIYARVGAYGRFIVRYTRDGQPVPFKVGVKVNGISGEGVVPGGEYVAIYLGSGGHSNVWRSGLDVTSIGDIVIQTHEFDKGDFLNALYSPDGSRVPVKDLDMTAFAKAGANKAPQSETVKKRGMGSLVEVWDKDGNEKCITAFEARSASAGVRMDAQGSLYIVDSFTIPGQRGFESLKSPEAYISPGAHLYPGSLVKFGWKGGTWPLARFVPRGQDPGMSGLKLEGPGGIVIGGATWAAQDASDTFSGDCGCPHSRFDLDLYARSWLPANHIKGVLVYDTNGNKILRVGSYGNADCQGKNSLVPEPDIGFNRLFAVAASDEALYAADGGNNRTLRAKLTYAAEESVELK
ncbi:MAG: hypothetical protein C0404_00705 [Verrucomicrobia bacterium]|nr:hypothetical protein [Verrucomicrobiota bacterium]